MMCDATRSRDVGSVPAIIYYTSSCTLARVWPEAINVSELRWMDFVCLLMMALLKSNYFIILIHPERLENVASRGNCLEQTTDRQTHHSVINEEELFLLVCARNGKTINILFNGAKQLKRLFAMISW